MSVNLSNASIAQWFAEREQHRCGYCKNPSGSISYGMLTEQLTVEDYKDLIDRGWRRSGKYCYKPTMDKTCCPQYTIRCDAAEFSLNKSHKKIIKKFNKFVKDGVFNKNVPQSQEEDDTRSEEPGYEKHGIINLNKSVTALGDSSSQVLLNTFWSEKVSCQSSSQEPTKVNVESRLGENQEDAVPTNPVVSNSFKKPLKDGTGADPNKPPCKKAKLLRLERKKEKLQEKGEEFVSVVKPNTMQKSLSEFLGEIPSTAKHKLKLKIIPTSECGDEWEQAKDIEFELYKKYQLIVHNDTIDRLTRRSFTRFLVSSPLKIVLERMSKKHGTFAVSAEVYRKYQMIVHNEPIAECGPDEYYQFLVNTPLKSKPFPPGIEGPGYGSFHQQYWIDEKLIAVGVIDILPGCVSSVYFFYDPDYRDLTLGTYGSLREIQLVQDLCNKIPDLRYYYMGFYIHSCPKMRYKGKLKPSYLLCPETYIWMPIEKCLGKLDVSKYSRLNEDIDAIDANHCKPNDIDTIKVVHDYKLMQVKDFQRIYGAYRNVFENLANLVGKRSSHNIIFWTE